MQPGRRLTEGARKSEDGGRSAGRRRFLGDFQIAVDAVTDAGGGRLDGVASEVGIACRRLNLGVAQKLPDHRQSFAERQGTRGKGVAKIVYSYVIKSGALADAPPRSLQVGEVRARQVRARPGAGCCGGRARTAQAVKPWILAFSALPVVGAAELWAGTPGFSEEGAFFGVLHR